MIGSSHFTGMDSLKKIVGRIEKRLGDVGLNPTSASRAAGLSDGAIYNLQRGASGKIKLKGGNAKTFSSLAPVLKTTVPWLTEGKGPETGEFDMRSEDVAESLDKTKAMPVKVKGYVGASSEAIYYRLSDEDFEEVEAPEGSSDQTVAVEIKGKSFGPLMNTWLVFYDDVRSPVTPDLLNQVCVVGLADDRILIKEIRRNGRGGYRLMSNSSTDEPIEDAQIEWAAKVKAMRPR